MVFVEAVCSIIENPTATSSGSESQSVREAAKSTSVTPNVAAITTMVRPRPSTVLRVASLTAPASAPRPTAAIRKPRVWAPPCRRNVAITGIRTVYGMPTSETIGEQQQHGADRAGSRGVVEAFAELRPGRACARPAPRTARTFIARSEPITAT